MVDIAQLKTEEFEIPDVGALKIEEFETPEVSVRQEEVVGTPPAGVPLAEEVQVNVETNELTPPSDRILPFEEFKKELREKGFGTPTTDEAITKFLKFTAISPIVMGQEAFQRARETGEDFFTSGLEAVKSGSIDAALLFGGQKLGKEAVKILGKGARKLAGLRAVGTSDDVIRYVEQNPEVVIKPTKSWKNIHTGMSKFINETRKDAGRKLGKLKELAKEVGSEAVLNNNALRSQVDDIARQIPEAARAEQRAMKEIQKFVGRESKFVGIEDSEKMLKNVDAIVDRIQRRPQQIGKIGESERLLLEARRAVKDFGNRIIDDIPNVGDDIIKAKKEYRKIMNVNSELRGISPSNMGQKFESVLKRNSETKLDSLKEILPKNIFDEALANVMNSRQALGTVRGISQIGAGGRGAIRAGLQTAAELAESASALAVSKRPEFAIGTIPEIGLGIREAARFTGRGLSALTGEEIRQQIQDGLR